MVNISQADVKTWNGTEWVMTNPLDAIPDSEANQKLEHRYLFDDVNGTAEDSVGNDDGSYNNITAISGDYAGGEAAESDGTGYIDLPIPHYGSMLADPTAFAFTIDNYTQETGTRRLIANTNSSPDIDLILEPDDRQIYFSIRDDSGDVARVRTDETGILNDGEPHRVVINIPDGVDNNEDTWEIWVDEEQPNQSVQSSGDSATSFSDFTEPLTVHGNNSDGDGIEAVLDDLCFFNDGLTESEIQSYQNPWS